jgi:serpin B
MSLFACSQSPAPDDTPPRPPTETERSLSKAAGSFGLTLFRRVSAAEPAKNTFLSPLSVSLALGMTLNAAQGETYDSMRGALALHGLTQDAINASYQSLTDLLLTTDRTVAMEIANSVWHRNTFFVQPSFTDVLTASFRAKVQALDFSAPSAAPTINAWVADATHDKITTIVPDPISDELVMFLVNAVYFKGNWSTQFDPSRTRSMPFTLSDRSIKDVQMMTRSGNVMAHVDGASAAFELPYGAGYYRMMFLMPTDGRTVEAMASELTDAAWDARVAAMKESKVDVFVPKFRLEYERELKQDLTALGMGIAFEPGRADLRRMNPDAELYISKVQHKTFVQVDEEGTEAAAVTSVGIGVTSAPPSIVLDRPFIFAIREANTGTVVFVGKVVEPKW